MYRWWPDNGWNNFEMKIATMYIITSVRLITWFIDGWCDRWSLCTAFRWSVANNSTVRVANDQRNAWPNFSGYQSLYWQWRTRNDKGLWLLSVSLVEQGSHEAVNGCHTRLPHILGYTDTELLLATTSGSYLWMKNNIWPLQRHQWL